MSVYDRWLNLRDRCLTSPRFHKAVARLPFIRPIVRKRQSELFDIVSGFVYSQILLACVELDVLNQVGSGRTVQDLAGSIGLGVDETQRLCEGAASVRLLEARKGQFRLGDLGAALLATPGAVAMIKHHPALYKDMADPVAFLTSGRAQTELSRFWDYAASREPTEDKRSKVYSDLMATSQDLVAGDILAAYDFSKHDTLLDMGGGHGAFIKAVAAEHVGLKLQLFDLPAVAAQAKEALGEAGLQDRVSIAPGSFFEDAPPKGADVVTLVRIIHDHDDVPAAAILKAAYDALPDGGTLLVCEPMLVGGSAERITGAYFNMYLYAMGSGRPRTPDTIQNMMKQIGFTDAKRLKTRFPLNASIVCGHKFVN